MFMKNQNLLVFVKNFNEGEKCVLQGDYVYFVELIIVEYKVEWNCDLIQIGNWFNLVGYGIVLFKGQDLFCRIEKKIINVF